MVINTGNRTDIPAFYAPWLMRRLEEGYVLVRNPYNESQVTRYRLSPDIVDLIVFCTKNPAPMLPLSPLLMAYRQFWFVTITPYGTDIEPHVPPYRCVMEDLRALSRVLGRGNVVWRYDPILIDAKYTVGNHIGKFEEMASFLSGYTEVCIISFIDLYEKVKRNFPQAKAVSAEDEIVLAKEFVRIGRRYGIRIKSCAEGDRLAPYGVDTSGCMTARIYEELIGRKLSMPLLKQNRQGCNCLLNGDIGAYNSCLHGCKYCYANYERSEVERNHAMHDPSSPLLIGHIRETDRIHDSDAHSWIEEQLEMEF